MSPEVFMKRALHLAERARRLTHPNPMVGAVLVKNHRVVAEGWHEAFGKAHAEAVAIRKAGKKSKGAILYVTLEPCSTFGKTPPCVDAIVSSGIRQVVVAALDPNPLHYGKGVRLLRKQGIRVDVGMLEQEARDQNEKFFVWMQKKRPFISVKMAMSLDGRIATDSGDSKWISSPESRQAVHELRAEHDAVMVGTTTCLKDKARLNVRHLQGAWREPIKIVLDAALKLPVSLPVFQINKPHQGLVVTKKGSVAENPGKAAILKRQGFEILEVSVSKGLFVLPDLLEKINQRGVSSVLVEGGGKLAGSFFDAALVDRVYFFYAPIIIGGKKSFLPVVSSGADQIKNAVKLSGIVIKKVGQDSLFTGIPSFKYCD